MALTQLTKIDGRGINTTSDYRVGILTAIKFVGPFDGTGGNFAGVITATDGVFSGNVTIGGTLTYEDVTNIDSVGIITARDGIHVGAGVSAVGVGTFGSLDIGGDVDVDGHTNLDNVSVAGVTTFASSIHVADSIIHEGDTDTKIDFDSNRIKLTVGNVLYSDIGLSAYNYFYRATNFVSTSSSPKPSTYIARFRDEEGDDMEVQFFNTNVKNSILTWNDTGNTTAAGNLIFKGIAGGSGLEHARFTGSGNFNLLRDLDVDGHTNLDNVSIAGVTTCGRIDTGTINVSAHADIRFASGNWSGNTTKIQNHNNYLYIVAPSNGFQFRIGGTDLWLMDSLSNDGNFWPTVDSGRDIGKSNRRVRNVYATTLYGDGSNLTGITQTTINNNATTKFITGTNNANELDCEANLSYNNSLVTFSNSSLMVDKSTNATISVKETTGNKEAQFRANTDGGLLRTLGNYPLIFGTNQTEKVRIDSAGRVMIGTTTEGNGNADEFTISYINHAGVSGGDQGRCGMTIRSGDNTSGVTQNGYIYFSDGTSGSNESMGVVAYEHSTDSMYFSTAQVEKLRIKSTGEVHISDRNSSNTGDHFFQAGAFGIRMEDTGGFNRWNIERNYGGYQSTPLIHLSAQGKVGINSATPFQTLDVRGSINGGTVNQPFLRFHDSHGDQRSTKHYFRCTKGGTSIYDILTVDINTNFHQALIILYYGARLQAINDSVTYPVHKIIGVNRFNGGSIQFTKNTIVQDGNVANHGDIDAVAMSSTQYRIRLTFSGSTGGSSFAAGHVEIIGLGPGTDGAFYSLAHAHGLTR